MTGALATMLPLLRIAAAPRGRLAVAVALGALTVVLGVALMACAGYLITRAAERPAILSLMVVIVAVRFCGLARPAARYCERLVSHDVALRALGKVRARVFERIEPLAPAQLAGHADGDMLSRMVADVDALQNLHLRGVIPPLVALLAGAAAAGAAAAILPVAGAALAVGLLLAGLVVPPLAGHPSRRAPERQASVRGVVSTELVELLGAAPELVAYGAENQALDRLRTADAALARVARRDALAAGLGDALGLLTAGLTVVAVLALAVAAHAGGDLDRVWIAALALLALASFEAVQPLIAVARELPATLDAGRRVLELTDQEPAIGDPLRPIVMPRGPLALELEDVSARYDADGPVVIDDVSLRLEPGSRVALVGASGAGKTTIVNLLLRFLDPDRGRIALAGADLRDYRLEDVRDAIAVAGQDSHLFATTIRENVRLGRPASAAEIQRALERARLWDWLRELPDGLDTIVGERGRALSAGQRQRVVLARALLVDAPVLVLDEPTAHLDAPLASELMHDILTAAGSRSVLLITHRPEGLELVDDIVEIGARA